MEWLKKKITVVGFARSGQGAARLAAQHGARVKITEKTDSPQIKEAVGRLGLKEVKAELGGHTREFIQDSDMLVLSPGVRMDSDPVRWAKEKGIPVISEIELGFSFCPAEIIAITGSCGKTTVTTLIGEVLKKTGRRVFICGNIGTPFCSQIENMQRGDLVSLEVSSFQLESIVNFRPKVAVFLNFSRNHLDRHSDMQDYLTQKKRIFMNQTSQDWAVLNYQDPVVSSLAKEVKSQVRYFNLVGKDDLSSNPNFSAALTVGSIFGVTPEDGLQILNNFKGVEHRLEFVRSVKGVDFINDSKATTVESAIWALNRIQKPIIMIAGGKDKGLDFTPIRDLISKRAKELILIGEAKEKIRKALDNALPMKEAVTLREAVETAFQDASKGDSILLCPMCASFDMFSDFEERGKRFKEIVNNF